jgi:hypothetical protein
VTSIPLRSHCLLPPLLLNTYMPELEHLNVERD